MPTSITANELNYLVYRYLEESSFVHATFNFEHEAAIKKVTSFDRSGVPLGALVRLVQKGLESLEMEANLNNNDTDAEKDYKFIKPFDLFTKDVDELRRMLDENKKQKVSGEPSKELPSEGKEKVAEDKQRVDEHKVKFSVDDNVIFAGSNTMKISNSSAPPPSKIQNSDVLIVQGHSEVVGSCAWSPEGLLLASGSADHTARIWAIADWTNSRSLKNSIRSVCVLKHDNGRPDRSRKGVTALDWNCNGSLLATSSMDGLARIWNTVDGVRISTLSKHKGVIWSIKWNMEGNYLLTASQDRTAIVWDVMAGAMKQQFKFHSGPTIDVDWQTNLTFASSSGDRMIYFCKVGQDQPIRMFSGHTGKVNVVKWDPSGNVLASCSEDSTVKIWSVHQDKCIHDFKDHAEGVYSIKWRPTGLATNNPNKQLLLASASNDNTVKLWNVEAGRLFRSLNYHRDHVLALSFSPNGEYLATGSMDNSMLIWSVKDGRLIKTYDSNGGIFDISWHNSGGKIAGVTTANQVFVMDFRM